VTPDELERILDEGNASGCIVFFANATEKQRKSLAKMAVGRLRSLTDTPMAQVLRRSERFGDILANRLTELLGIPTHQLVAAQVAVLASASIAELKRLRLRAVPPPQEAYEVLVSRRPPWLDDWAEFVCEISVECWPAVRRLVREGICRRPSGDAYIERMIQFIDGSSANRRPFADVLLEDPGLLEDEIWRFFELEPKRLQLDLLTDWRRMPAEYSWSATLVKLSDEGKLARSRLLDATLDGLHRDLHEIRARWFAGLHDRLSPTVDERAERSGRYFSLLQSRNNSTVLFAAKTLAELQKAGRLEPSDVLDNVRPALAGRTKAVVSAALKLFDGAARDGDSGNRAAEVAAEALLHDWPDVQKSAVNIIERYGRADDAALRDVVRERLDGVAPSQRHRLTAWLASAVTATAATPTEDVDPDALLDSVRSLDARLCELAGVPALVDICGNGGEDIPALTLDPMAIPRLDPQRRIVPIDDLDTLLERFAAVLEDPSSPDEVERVLDGVSRLCGQQSEDFFDRAAPLHAQAADIFCNIGRTEWSESSLRLPLSWLAFRWAKRPVRDDYAEILRGLQPVVGVWGGVPGRPAESDPFERIPEVGTGRGGLFRKRLEVIGARLVRRVAVPLLSTPTHEGGWIDPRVFVERASMWQSLDRIPCNLDRALGLLRLAPDQRPAALAAARSLQGEFGDVVRYALGGEVESIGPTDTLWVAAARARAPLADDERVEERHPHKGPDAGRVKHYRLREIRMRSGRGLWDARRPPLLERLPAVLAPNTENFPSVALHYDVQYGFETGLNRWLETVWPLARESYFAQGVERVVGCDGGPTEARALRPFLEALFDPDTPLTGFGGLLLTGALSAKQAELSLLATDALIAAIDDGRVDRVLLGQALATLLPTGLLKLNRLAKTLGAAAKVSPLHGYVIAGALQQGLCCAEELLARFATWAGLGGLLRLLQERLIESGEPVRNAVFRKVLSGLKAAAGTAALIRQLLALEETKSGSAVKAAAGYALGQRIARVERWSRWEAATVTEPASQSMR
jgi:hypothetical protein